MIKYLIGNIQTGLNFYITNNISCTYQTIHSCSCPKCGKLQTKISRMQRHKQNMHTQKKQQQTNTHTQKNNKKNNKKTNTHTK